MTINCRTVVNYGHTLSPPDTRLRFYIQHKMGKKRFSPFIGQVIKPENSAYSHNQLQTQNMLNKGQT